MDTAPQVSLFDRLAQLAAAVKAIRKEAAHIARSIDESTEAGADLRLQLEHAADCLEESADLLRPARRTFRSLQPIVVDLARFEN